MTNELDTHKSGSSKVKGFPMFAMADYVIVSWPEAPEEMRTKSGLFLVGQEEKAHADTSVATVLSVGPGHNRTDGDRMSLDVEPGDQIMFPLVRMKNMRIEGIDYGCVMNQDILAVIDKKVIPNYKPVTTVDITKNRGGSDILDGEPGRPNQY